jgi:hypothetical protein
MPQIPPAGLDLYHQHSNSRVCRSDAERMETVWRSSSRGVSTRPPARAAAPQRVNPKSRKRTAPERACVTERRAWHLGIEFGTPLRSPVTGQQRDPALLTELPQRGRAPDRRRRPHRLHAQMDSAANHPAQHVPTFVPRLAGTTMSQRSEMPNSVLIHTCGARRDPGAGPESGRL